MPTKELVQWLFLVFFIYGLAFFAMGVAMALESGRRLALADARVLRPLAAFGLLHGTHEWMESYLLQAQAVGTPLGVLVSPFKLVLLVSSFICLFLFAVNLLRLTSSRSGLPQWHIVIFGSYAVLVLTSASLAYSIIPIPWANLLDGLARYLLAVPASMLAALALRARGLQARAEDRPALEKSFYLAALGFGIYSITQAFVHPLDMFPANLLNEENFLAASGFPIQVIRASTAILITYGLLRATQAVEEERNLQLFAVQQARLQALQQRDELRRNLLRHTVQVQEEERARVARELHDETAQILSAASLHLAALRASLKRKPDAIAIVEQLQDLTRQMSHSLYRLVRDLRPAHLDDLGLVPALDFLVEDARVTKGMDVRLTVEGTPRRIDVSIETILFRVTQEALTNIFRHAQTQQGQVRLCFSGDQVRLTVTDLGQGFDIEGPFHAPRGWGLEGMRERIESAGGTFLLTSAVGKGTTVEALIPLQGVNNDN